MDTTRWLRIAIALFALHMTADAHSADAVVAMHGFQIDFRLTSDREKSAVLKSLERQFEIVEEANLPSNVIEFFRTVPVVIDPSMSKEKGFARYGEHEGRPTVIIRPDKLPSDRPIVLHELLHAFHHQVLKQPTPQVGQAYQHALQSGIYPKRYSGAHFLENGREYFAVIASIYLFGKKIDQPPYDCSIAAKHQPEFIAFLAQHFGEHKCK